VTVEVAVSLDLRYYSVGAAFAAAAVVQQHATSNVISVAFLLMLGVVMYLAADVFVGIAIQLLVPIAQWPVVDFVFEMLCTQKFVRACASFTLFAWVCLAASWQSTAGFVAAGLMFTYFHWADVKERNEKYEREQAFRAAHQQLP
jgi:hypothetical protein